MGRKRHSVDDATIQRAESALSDISDWPMVIKLYTIVNYNQFSTRQISTLFRHSPRTLLRWIDSFKQKGIEGIRDRPKGHRKALLSDQDKQVISDWICTQKNSQGKPMHWTLHTLRQTIAEELHVEIGKSALAINLHAMGIVLRKPRPTHVQGDPEKQDAFKKNERRR
jgi:transposase